MFMLGFFCTCAGMQFAVVGCTERKRSHLGQETKALSYTGHSNLSWVVSLWMKTASVRRFRISPIASSVARPWIALGERGAVLAEVGQPLVLKAADPVGYAEVAEVD